MGPCLASFAPRAAYEALGAAYEAVAARLRNLVRDDEEDVTTLRRLVDGALDDQLRLVLATLDRAVYVESPAALDGPGTNIAETDARAAAEAFARDGLVVLDDALTAGALAGLRAQLVNSTVWYDVKRGHLGAYLEDGLASGLILQLADDFVAALPEVLGDMRLVQAWGFKC